MTEAIKYFLNWMSVTEKSVLARPNGMGIKRDRKVILNPFSLLSMTDLMALR
jgi:hypothetical protein